MTRLEIVALQAILNRVTQAKGWYDMSNKTGISETQADNYWAEATSNISEALSLLQFAVQEN